MNSMMLNIEMPKNSPSSPPQLANKQFTVSYYSFSIFIFSGIEFFTNKVRRRIRFRPHKGGHLMISEVNFQVARLRSMVQRENW